MVDTTLDKLLLLAIESSTEIVTPAVLNDDDNIITEAEVLSDIPIYFLGDKRMQTASERIVLARTGNKNNGSDGFDFTQRKVTFGFNIQIKETKDYLKAQDRINNIEQALVRTLIKSEELSEYNDTMSIDDIDPYPNEEDMILQTEEMFVSFIIDEEWSVEDKEFDRIAYSGEMI